MPDNNAEILIKAATRNLAAVLSLPSAGMLRNLKSRLLGEVDGGIDPRTAPRCLKAGATLFVAGSAVFDAEQPGAVLAGRRQPVKQPLHRRRARHRDGALETGDVERLGRRSQRHPDLGRGAAQRHERRVLCAGQRERVGDELERMAREVEP